MATKITDYSKVKDTIFDTGAASFVRGTVGRNLNSPLDSNCGRSINGGQVGNRHALKRGFRMWDHSGNVISRGNNPIKRESYSPDF